MFASFLYNVLGIYYQTFYTFYNRYVFSALRPLCEDTVIFTGNNSRTRSTTTTSTTTLTTLYLNNSRTPLENQPGMLSRASVALSVQNKWTIHNTYLWLTYILTTLFFPGLICLHYPVFIRRHTLCTCCTTVRLPL